MRVAFDFLYAPLTSHTALAGFSRNVIELRLMIEMNDIRGEMTHAEAYANACRVAADGVSVASKGPCN